MWDVKPGDEVICINAEFTTIQKLLIHNLPVLYDKYTLREIEMMQDQPNVRLEEIVNQLIRTEFGDIEPAFHLNRFRPVTKYDRITDISLFREILNTIPKDAQPDDEEYLFKKEKVNDREKTANSGIQSYSGRSY